MNHAQLTELKYHLIIAKMKQNEALIFTYKPLHGAVMETLK